MGVGKGCSQIMSIYASLNAGDEDVLLSVIGIQCTIFEDRNGQITEALERNLLHWGPDKQALLDRFDARLLLDNVAAPAPSRSGILKPLYSHVCMLTMVSEGTVRHIKSMQA